MASNWWSWNFHRDRYTVSGAERTTTDKKSSQKNVPNTMQAPLRYAAPLPGQPVPTEPYQRPPIYLMSVASSLSHPNVKVPKNLHRNSIRNSITGSFSKRRPSSAKVLFPADNDSVDDDDVPELHRSPTSLDNLSILSQSPVPQGRVSFWKEFAYEVEGRPYARVNYDTPMEDIGQIMGHDWKLSLPTIVMVVISNFTGNVEWEGHRQWTNLKRGLIEAANTTNMWILTHGGNVGVPKMLGDLIRQEEQKRESMKCHRHPKQTASRAPDLHLMGIINERRVMYEELLDGKQPKVEVQNRGGSEGKVDLNPEHSHFFLVHDGTSDCSGVLKFLTKLEQYMLTNHSVGSGDFVDESFVGRGRQTEGQTIGNSEIPVIALLMGGGEKSIVMVLEHVKNQIPVVVIKGSGGTADLLAYAYQEIKENTRGDWDPDYVENFIKSELSRRIAVAFPSHRTNNLSRNKFRERVLECVRLSHEAKTERVYLTFLDINNHSVNLSELNQHLLRALFNATDRVEENVSTSFQRFQKDLYLTLDWNSPHIAQSEIFQKNAVSVYKYKVDKEIFEAALVRSDREGFVSLFLDQGFQVHKFLSEKRFRRLFEKAESPEFFRTVCLEGALGYSFSLKIGKDFIQNDFNWLIKHLTKLRNFVDAEDLTNNSMGMYTVVDPRIAERKAQTLLALWAVVMNRPKLVKELWKRADYPIHLALVIGLMYTKLVAYVRETHLIQEMEDRGKEFEVMAVDVLDRSFQQNNCRAFDILSEQIDEWNFKTAVEIAADARNRAFIAHPCCQKWLTNLFFGDIRIRELKWGSVTLPIWIKVVLSAFFIFPMYIWVHFKTGQKRSILGIYDDGGSEEASDCESEPDTVSQPPLSRMCSREGRQSIPMNAFNNRLENLDETRKTNKGTWAWTMLPTPVTVLQYFQPRPQPNLWKKIYIMWNAPVTKFWTYQIFYILFLGAFSMAVLMPGCGKLYLDIFVWIWTALILMENVRKAYIQYRDYSSVPLLASIIEIVLIFVFLLLYLAVRILPVNGVTQSVLHMPFISPYMARVILCFGLLYFYYRFIWIYLPISPTLGPLLFRIKLMVTVDFIHFLRLTLLFIISGGIVIHAVIYPDYPMSSELLRRVFHRAWFTLFITPIDDLEGFSRCRNKTYHEAVCTKEYTSSKWWHNYSPDDDMQYRDCPNTGFIPYLMVIQYLIILKLILVTLLTALYSNTAQRAAQDTDAIWKFQRYHLVLDFNARYRLPAPLNAISFVLSLVEKICNALMCQYCQKKPEPDKAEKLRLLRLKQNDHNYWRALANAYSNEQESKEREKDLPAKQSECMRTLLEDMEHQKQMFSRMKGQITELEKIMLSSRISLEEIKHEISAEDTKVMESSNIHLLSRQSPYPGTRVKRFPLADRYVPWEVLYSVYDPVVYSKPRNEFRSDERDCVDEDLLLMREDQGANIILPDLKWNFAYTSGAGVTTDRRSWLLTESGEPLIYKLDAALLPTNPMGRTGLRGRGGLHRWGPNHCILLVVTKWRSADDFMQSVNVAEEHKYLEFITMLDHNSPNMLSLPGGFVMNYDCIYEVIKKQFANEPIHESWTAEKMQEYFAQFARAPAGDFVDIVGEDAEQLNFTASMLLKGYIDDNRNTDNAWIEAEVWHFHYTASQTLDPHLPNRFRWKRVTSNLTAKMTPSQSAIIHEVNRRMVIN